MPIDPNIANPKMFQMPDPMDSMGKVLTNALMVEKMRGLGDERASTNAMNKYYQQAYSNGKFDPADYERRVALGGYGSTLPAWAKGQAEIDEIKSKSAKGYADAAKTKVDTVKTELDNFKSVVAQLAGTPNVSPEQMYSVLGAGFNNPVIGDWYAQMKITPEVMKQGIDHAAKSGRVSDVARLLMLGDKALEQQYHVIQEEGKQSLVGSNKYGTPNAAVAATYGPKPEGQGTRVTVNMPGEKAVNKFGEKLAEIRAQRLGDLEAAADQARGKIPEINRVLGIIDSGKVILGAGSPLLLDMARVAKAMGMPIEDESMVNTEDVTRFFARNTLGNIATFKQQGVALTPMSDSDRRLIEMASVQGTNDPATIKRLLMLQRKVEEDIITKYETMARQYTENDATAPVMSALGGSTVPGVTYTKPTAKHIEALKKNRGMAAQFNEKFGPGAAERILGGGGGGSFNPPSEGTGGTARWAPQIQHAAAQYGVPIEVVQEVMRHESGGNPKALSPVGAIGLMQLMPGTARGLNVNPHDPAQNILGGVKYLRQLYNQTGSWTQAIAAYNGGLSSTGYSKDKGHEHQRKWENPNNRGWAETRNYVRNIKGSLKKRGVEISAAPTNALMGRGYDA